MLMFDVLVGKLLHSKESYLGRYGLKMRLVMNLVTIVLPNLRNIDIDVFS